MHGCDVLSVLVWQVSFLCDGLSRDGRMQSGAFASRANAAGKLIGEGLVDPE